MLPRRRTGSTVIHDASWCSTRHLSYCCPLSCPVVVLIGTEDAQKSLRQVCSLACSGSARQACAKRGYKAGKRTFMLDVKRAA